MSETSPLLLAVVVLGLGALAYLGMQGLFEIRAALRNGEFDRLAGIRFLPATRAFCGLCAALPVYLATRSLGPAAFGAAACAAGLGYAVAPMFRDEARRRAE